MSMHGRNDRSVHTDYLKISRNLSRHSELMARFEAFGMPRASASKLAFDVVRKVISESDAIAKAEGA